MSDLAELVEAEQSRFEVPGCAVVALAGGEVVLRAGFGLRDREQQLPVTERTIFPIGSSTKTFTAALCATLVDAGRLSWHRPVREYLPGFRMADPVTTEHVSVFDLLCHRSGLPRHDLLWYADDCDMDRTALVRALAHLQPNHPLRERWQYNNILYATAGELAGQLLGLSYEDAVRQQLLDPLGMTRTNFSVTVSQRDDDYAQPYAPDADDALSRVPFASLDLIGAAGNINSSIEEMTQWLRCLLGHSVDGPPLLPPGLLATLQAPAAPLPDGSLLTAHRAVGYGLGLIAEDYCGHRVLCHGGNIDGFSSQVSFIPEADCGVVVLTNRDGTALRDALPFVLYDALLGLPPQDHGAHLLERERAMRQGRAQQREHARADTLNLPAVRPLADYVGDYRHPAYGLLRITTDGDGLAGTYRALAGPLQHRHLEVFNLVVDLGGVLTPLPLRFTHDFDGDVTAALCPLEANADPIRFERVPDEGGLSDEVLVGLVGTYRLGPLTATVSRRGASGLTAIIAEGGPQELTLVHGTVFRSGAARIEFSDDGRLITPVGDFVRA